MTPLVPPGLEPPRSRDGPKHGSGASTSPRGDRRRPVDLESPDYPDRQGGRPRHPPYHPRRPRQAPSRRGRRRRVPRPTARSTREGRRELTRRSRPCAGQRSPHRADRGHTVVPASGARPGRPHRGNPPPIPSDTEPAAAGGEYGSGTFTADGEQRPLGGTGMTDTTPRPGRAMSPPDWASDSDHDQGR
jgi:hypothetical protein